MYRYKHTVTLQISHYYSEFLPLLRNPTISQEFTFTVGSFSTSKIPFNLLPGLAFFYFFTDSHGLGAYEKTESHVTLIESQGILILEREKEQKFNSFNFSYICIIYM